MAPAQMPSILGWSKRYAKALERKASDPTRASDNAKRHALIRKAELERLVQAGEMTEDDFHEAMIEIDAVLDFVPPDADKESPSDHMLVPVQETTVDDAPLGDGNQELPADLPPVHVAPVTVTVPAAEAEPAVAQADEKQAEPETLDLPALPRRGKGRR